MATFTGLPQILSPDHVYFQLFLIAREVVKSQMKFKACCTSMVTALWQTAWKISLAAPANARPRHRNLSPFREAVARGYLLLDFTNIYTRL